jgi:transposase-like protein
MPTEREINTLYELSQADFKLYLTERARGLVRVLLEEVMQAELTALLQAQPYERNAQRRGQRNGRYGRDLTTSLGRLEEVQVPRDRAGQFQTRVFEQYQRRQGEVDQAIQTMFIKGLSTTAVGQVVGPLLDDAPSPSTVSRIFHSLDEECTAWRQRPLDTHYRYIYLDGTYFTIGYEDDYEKTPILAAMGVKENGERDVLGFMPGDKESRPAWDEFLDDLKGRGGAGADLWITDGGPAVIGAVEAKFPGAKRQRCVVHKIENILARVPKSKQEDVRNELNRIFYLAANRDKAQQEVEAFTAKWQSILPDAVQCLLKDLADCLRFYDFPKKHWRSIRTNNYIERLFNGVKMRTHSMGAFRNENSCILVFYAVIRSMHFRKLSLPA